MVVVAFDCATKTGWCAMEDGKVIQSGRAEFTKTKGESNGVRYAMFTKFVDNVLERFEPSLVVYEMAHHRGKAATEIAYAFTSRVVEAAAKRGALCRSVHSGTLKKHITGNGKAEKADMIKAIEEKYDMKVCTDDEADAIALCDYAEANLKTGRRNGCTTR